MADHYKVELGRAIKRRREELGLTQKDLADLTHYKEAQTVSRWERGENAPGDLEVVAGALQWTLAEMVAGIKPPDRRTARRFGSPTENDESQLDRVERQVAELHDLLLGDGHDEEVVAGIAARLLQADGSPLRTAAGRSKTPQGDQRRKSA